MQNSQLLVTKLSEISSTLDGYSRVQQFVKILYSILPSFFSGEISYINVFEFIKELIKITGESYQYKSKYLRELTRMLLYMLVDMDERPPSDGCQDLSKQVNKCILNILETSDSRHLLEILFLLGKQHLELNRSLKLQQIIFKCILKTIKYIDFTHNPKENSRYILEQLNSIFNQFNLKP